MRSAWRGLLLAGAGLESADISFPAPVSGRRDKGQTEVDCSKEEAHARAPPFTPFTVPGGFAGIDAVIVISFQQGISARIADHRSWGMRQKQIV